MKEEARIIEKVKEILADVEPDVAIRVIDYLTINHRPELKELRDAPQRIPDPEGVTSKTPAFLRTQRRMEAAAVLREVERIKKERAKDDDEKGLRAMRARG